MRHGCVYSAACLVRITNSVEWEMSAPLSDTATSKVIRRVLSTDSDALLEDGPDHLPKTLPGCIWTFVPFVRKKGSGEDCEEHIAPETAREDELQNVHILQKWPLSPSEDDTTNSSGCGLGGNPGIKRDVPNVARPQLVQRASWPDLWHPQIE
ncbi:hypothetical protein EDD15DRAFT_1900929 [Pisolithus albus]|nr:hypothetical protein EDD15DRAFT_1900929 [Pisolithus albus]